MPTSTTTAPATAATAATADATADADFAALFDLDPRSYPVGDVGALPDSSGCTDDGCTGSCVSCGCDGDE